LILLSISYPHILLHQYPVFPPPNSSLIPKLATNSNPSSDTKSRAESAGIEALPSDTALVSASSYILSIVPPRDALSTARRIVTALSSPSTTRATPLYYLDLNAVAPRTTVSIAELFTDINVVFIDGAIIGGSPHPLTSFPTSTPPTPPSTDPDASTITPQWYVPRIPQSGPNPLSASSASGAHLAQTLNSRHISATIGQASGLKMCFAATTKGFTALAIQSFTTAGNLGVLSELREEMSILVPGLARFAEKGVTGMGPKAYRWVREMEEIGDTFAVEGGFENEVFKGIAHVYKSVAEDTVLGQEKIGKRNRGTTVEDVARAVGEGLGAKRKKRE
jgi:hypothetical protein